MMKADVLGNLKRGLVFVVSAPAGTGKTTLGQMLTKEFPCVVNSISSTTRPPRAGEEEGVHYHFISEKEFNKKIEDEEFLEHVSLYGTLYGTSRKEVEKKLDKGKHVILTIDTQGAMQLRGRFPAIFIFIKPPSFEELERRLKKRKTESDEAVRQRLEWARHEIEASRHYDYCIVNDDLSVTYQVLRSILIAEEHRILVS